VISLADQNLFNDASLEVLHGLFAAFGGDQPGGDNCATQGGGCGPSTQAEEGENDNAVADHRVNAGIVAL
jgi:hypothetical protein